MDIESKEVTFIMKYIEEEYYIEMNNIIYKIIYNLGKGSVGKVYLINKLKDMQETDEKFVIKISNKDSYHDLVDEVVTIYNCFVNNKINEKNMPLFFGKMTSVSNNQHYAVIYNFYGYHNLEYIKEKINIMVFKYNKIIIKQIIEQMIELKDIIHCDLKSSNIVINFNNMNNITATIVDFGLMHHKDNAINLISTVYVASPESLLTYQKYKDCIEDKVDITKSDYFGLFSIIINLFSKKSYWDILYQYIGKHLKFDHKKLTDSDYKYIIIYILYKFNYDNMQKNKIIESKTLLNLIIEIEIKYPYIIKDNYLNFDEFYNKFILPNLDENATDGNDIKPFLLKIIDFDPNKRTELKELLLDKLFY